MLHILNTHWSDFWALFYGMLPLSLLTIGGAITILPALHQLTTTDHTWLSDTQFNASIAIAQAAPGPNILFIAVMGWNVGLALAASHAGLPLGYGYILGVLGASLAMLGIMIPSSVLVYFAGKWVNQNATLLPVKAFKAGMAPIVVALLVSAGWILALGKSTPSLGTAALVLVTTLLAWRSNLHLLVLLGAGAVCGVLGWV